uniref:Flap endonuclease GEN-like 2 n=1 Tax=Rhizophora mucronata TaxID=61149 RepID=A0A2P2K2K9_RHIMU
MLMPWCIPCIQESACHVVKSVGDNNILQQVVSQGLSFAKKTKISKKHGGNLDCNKKPSSSDPEVDFMAGNDSVPEKQGQFLQVIDAYLKPKCHSADSDAVCRILALHPFLRAELQEICAQFFGWPPDKTDEYILPRIAERDLRRFANLRSTSAQLGVNPSPYEMPVKCPVSEIIKTRKVQGRECFELLWEGLDGLKTCILPADLIESACPEKIAEFEERRALGKKQNHQKRRPKTLEKISAMPDINSKLETLLFDIELGSDTANCSASFHTSTKISETRTSSTALNFTNQDLLNANAITSRYRGGASIAKNEVIDLLSPSPPRRDDTVSRFQGNDPSIDLVELSESETEMSPEHARKARELRVFLASIRGEIS